MTCKGCQDVRAKIRRLWYRFTGAEQAFLKAQNIAWRHHEGLCQSFNQLESNTVDLRRETKKRNMELQAEIDRARNRFSELMDDRLAAHRNALIELRGKIMRAEDEVDAAKAELDLMQNRLRVLESPAPVKL